MKYLIPIWVVLLLSSTAIAQEVEQHSPQKQIRETKTINFQLPLTETPQTITIEEVDNKAIYQGDIVLYELDDPNVSSDAGMVRYGNNGHDYRWPGGIMPYVIEADHPKKTNIEEAIRIVNEETVLELRPKTGNDDYYVEFVNGNGCSSPVGRSPRGVNTITVGWCGGMSIVHEILHSAGMWHEQSRSDRDEYIRVNFENIEEGRSHNFTKHDKTLSVCEYDYGSLMQYSDWAFAKETGLKTITPLKPLPAGVSMGQRDGLSSCDIKGISNLYSAALANGKQLNDKKWDNTAAMTELNSYLYIIQDDRLWEVNPNSGEYKQLGKQVWRNTAAMTAFDNKLYVIQNNKLWEANPNNGEYKQLGKQVWGNTAGMIKWHNKLYVIQSDRLWEVNPNNGEYKQLGKPAWSNTAAMTALNNDLYVVQNNKLWEANPMNGEYKRLGNAGWSNTAAITAFYTKLIVVQNNKLYEANSNNGEYKQLGKQEWSNVAAMIAWNYKLYVVQNDKLWVITP